MENKYYTPEIEEFHVGFEYEHLAKGYLWFLNGGGPKDTWMKETFSGGAGQDGESEVCELDTLIDDKAVRVKHLDREDIESLGFTQITDDCFNISIKEYRGRLSQEVRILFRKTILIYLAMDLDLGDKDNLVLFTGTIKNKSELKVLLKQIGV